MCLSKLWDSHLVQVAQVILSIWGCSVTGFPDGTSYTSRLYAPVDICFETFQVRG